MDNRTQPERAFAVRAIEDGEPGQISGYASVFGVVDTYDTVFDRGSFKKTIKDRGNSVPIVWMHEAYTPIGLAHVEEDDHGLKFVGQLDLDVQRGAEVYSGIKKGYIKKMSHSFKEVKSVRVKSDGKELKHFKEVRLFEISPVTTNFESNAMADIVEVRTKEEPMAIPDEIRTQLDRLEALLSEPLNGTRKTEPLGKPDFHLQRIQKQIDRITNYRSDQDG